MSDQAFGGDPYAAVLADLHRRRDEIENAIQVLEAVRSKQPGAIKQIDRTPAPTQLASEPVTFAGMSIGDASKKFLAMKGSPSNSADIAIGLAAHGMAMGAADPANVVSSVLTRRFNSIGDVVRVSRGIWGLAEWYPNREFDNKASGKPVGILVSGNIFSDAEVDAES